MAFVQSLQIANALVVHPRASCARTGANRPRTKRRMRCSWSMAVAGTNQNQVKNGHFTGTYHSSDHFETAVGPFEASSLNPPPASAAYEGLSLDESLAIVSEYASHLRNALHDPTVAFLRGQLLAQHGELQRAVAQLSLSIESGMQHIPDPFELRALCYFKLGALDLVRDDLKSASDIRVETIGNALHVYKWWKDTFSSAIPHIETVKKPWPLQRAIMLFCIGEYRQAREALVLESILHEPETNTEFALWDLACVARIKGIKAVASERLTAHELACAPDGLCEFLELYRETDAERIEKLRESMQHELRSDETGQHPFAARHRFYLALHYDAFGVGSEAVCLKQTWLQDALEAGLDKTLEAAAHAMLPMVSA
eukprot:CAMPEP_0185848370 /NCGR_PEP_ID=MMETSP1354-20130828/3277_1 /TAXON_ID=708628 /ORGANISM="Erythrolobus madagascarensis, Strain CCMP3276" /LENGTH=370 /DNA_ID=CAMNT_0028548761 /DNA_START=55 /DNA_END=1167 /DNA_ORIENTATION=+